MRMERGLANLVAINGTRPEHSSRFMVAHRKNSKNHQKKASRKKPESRSRSNFKPAPRDIAPPPPPPVDDDAPAEDEEPKPEDLAREEEAAKLAEAQEAARGPEPEVPAARHE